MISIFSRTQVLGLAAVMTLAATTQTESLAAESKKPSFSIVVSDMHCSDCAQKIANRLYKVAGVSKVHANLKSNTAYVTPGKGKAVSARELWEAVEKAEFTPVKLVSPSGTYTEKPKS